MSFDYNPQPQTNPEIDQQTEPQMFNAFNEEDSKKPPVPLDDVALGVSYYYGAIKTVILAFLVGLALVIVYTFVGTANNYSSALLQKENLNIFVGVLTLLILAIAAPFLVKSISCFCKTPSIIYPNSKLTVISSWGIWIIAYILSMASGSIANSNDGSFNSALSVIANILFAISACMFMSFLSSIGKFCLPEKKGCTGAIVLIMAWYGISILGILGSGDNLETLNSDAPSSEDNPALGIMKLGGFLYLIGWVMYLSYIEKLNKFFRIKFDIKKLKKENAKKSAYSSFFIALVVFSALGLICYVVSVIPNLNNGIDNVKVQQTLEDYAKIEESALNDWNATFAQYTNQKMSDEQFDNWIVNTHVPEWEKALSVLDQAKEINNNPVINMLKTITQDRIAYCQGFHAACQQHSEELYLKAYQDFQRVDLKVTKLTYFNKEVPKEAALKALHKAVVADDIEMAKWAISNGADVNEAIEGIKPIQRAQQLKIQDMIDFLKENGATE